MPQLAGCSRFATIVSISKWCVGAHKIRAAHRRASLAAQGFLGFLRRKEGVLPKNNLKTADKFLTFYVFQMTTRALHT